MSAFWQALLALGSATPAPVIGPLRTLYFDDQDFAFFTYTGQWNYFVGSGWPGGARNNTVSLRAAVLFSETLPTWTTRAVTFQGTADEGIDLWGSSENDGPSLFFVRSLDRPGSGWAQLGQPIGPGTYRYQWARPNVPGDLADRGNYYDAFIGESNYGKLGDPGIISLRGLPAGRYEFQLHKLANTTNPNDNGNRALYFDGCTVYTCDPNFS